MKYLILSIFLALGLTSAPLRALAVSDNTLTIYSELSTAGKVSFSPNLTFLNNLQPEQKLIIGLESDRIQIKILDKPGIKMPSLRFIVNLDQLKILDISKISTKEYTLDGVNVVSEQLKNTTASFAVENIFPDSLWTIELIFPKGVLKPTFWSKLMYWSANSSIIWFVISFLLLILVNLFLLFVLFRRFYSDFISRSKKTLRAPPTDLYSAAVALLEHQYDTSRAISSGILYLAARGYLMVIKKNNHFYIAKCTEPPDYLALDCVIYNLFFGRWFAWSAKEIKIESTMAIFNEMAGEIYHFIYYDLQKRHLFIKDYRMSIHKTRVLGIFLFLISSILFVTSLNILPYPPYASIVWVSLIISSTIIIHISRSFSVRTNKGTKERKHWQSFKNYLSDGSLATEHDLPMDIYLHYAVALGCEQQWITKFRTNKCPVWFKNFDQDSSKPDNLELVKFVLALCHLINKYKPPEEI